MGALDGSLRSGGLLCRLGLTLKVARRAWSSRLTSTREAEAGAQGWRPSCQSGSQKIKSELADRERGSVQMHPRVYPGELHQKS